MCAKRYLVLVWFLMERLVSVESIVLSIQALQFHTTHDMLLCNIFLHFRIFSSWASTAKHQTNADM